MILEHFLCSRDSSSPPHPHGVRSSLSFGLVWAVQVAVAILLLPVLLVVLVVGAAGALLVWLAELVHGMIAADALDSGERPGGPEHPDGAAPRS